MEKDYNELDKLFKEAFLRAKIKSPEEDFAWYKMQKKLLKKRLNTFFFLSNLAVFTVVLFSYLSLYDQIVKSDYDHIPLNLPIVDPSDHDDPSNEHTLTHSDSKHVVKIAPSKNSDPKLSVEKTPLTAIAEQSVTIDPQPDIPIPPKSNKVAPDFESTEGKWPRLTKDEFKIIKKSNIVWALSSGVMIHNHWVQEGKYVGSNLPFVGIIMSKNLHRNLDVMTGFRYMQRSNMSYSRSSKVRQVYNQEEFNLYTLYVNGTHWLEIPLGIQYYLPERKIHLAACLTTDFLLYEKARLGVKTQIPALSYESEERLKRARNLDSGIPLVNFGLRTEFGTLLNAKNALNLFVKISPYSGQTHTDINKKFGLDLGIEWRYYF